MKSSIGEIHHEITCFIPNRNLRGRAHFAAIAAAPSATTPPPLRPSAPPFQPRRNDYLSHDYAVMHGLADGPTQPPPSAPPLAPLSSRNVSSRPPTPPPPYGMPMWLREAERMLATAPSFPPPLLAADSPSTRETAPPPSTPLAAPPLPVPDVPPLLPRSFAAVAALAATSRPPPPAPLDRKAYGSCGSNPRSTLAASLDALDFDSEGEDELPEFPSPHRRAARTRKRVLRQSHRWA